MKRLKLNIQKFSSTNKTTHYNLSQYIGTDKPTYLVDYNADMSAIDTGIYNAQGKANTNESAIGTLSSLTTDVKTDLVSAINEVDSHADTNATNISNNTTDIATNTSAIGTLTNLDTTAKSNLVSAINEVNGKTDLNTTNIDKFNLTSFISYAGSQMSCSNGTVASYSNITVATNSDGSICKVYGTLFINTTVESGITVTILGTNLRPTSAITINNCSLTLYGGSGLIGEDMQISPNGNIVFTLYNIANTTHRHTVIPCLYFMKDFGDTPTQ